MCESTAITNERQRWEERVQENIKLLEHFRPGIRITLESRDYSKILMQMFSKIEGLVSEQYVEYYERRNVNGITAEYQINELADVNTKILAEFLPPLSPGMSECVEIRINLEDALLGNDTMVYTWLTQNTFEYFERIYLNEGYQKVEKYKDNSSIGGKSTVTNNNIDEDDKINEIYGLPVRPIQSEGLPASTNELELLATKLINYFVHNDSAENPEISEQSYFLLLTLLVANHSWFVAQTYRAKYQNGQQDRIKPDKKTRV